MKLGKYVYKIILNRRNGDKDTYLHGSFNVEGVI